MTEGIWLLAMVGIAVGWGVISEARAHEAQHRKQREREQESAADSLRAKQLDRYTKMRRAGIHILDRSDWASSVDRAPSLQKRASLTVLKGAKQ